MTEPPTPPMSRPSWLRRFLEQEWERQASEPPEERARIELENSLA